MDVGTREKQII